MASEVVIDGVVYTRRDLERWYTVSELCELTGFKKSRINAAIRSGHLTAKAPNGGSRYRMVSESEWNRFLEEELS